MGWRSLVERVARGGVGRAGVGLREQARLGAAEAGRAEHLTYGRCAGRGGSSRTAPWESLLCCVRAAGLPESGLDAPGRPPCPEFATRGQGWWRVTYGSKSFGACSPLCPYPQFPFGFPGNVQFVLDNQARRNWSRCRIQNGSERVRQPLRPMPPEYRSLIQQRDRLPPPSDAFDRPDGCSDTP